MPVVGKSELRSNTRQWPSGLAMASKLSGEVRLRCSFRNFFIECPLQLCGRGEVSEVFFHVLATSSFLLLVVRPGAPSSVLAPSSDARSP